MVASKQVGQSEVVTSETGAELSSPEKREPGAGSKKANDKAVIIVI